MLHLGGARIELVKPTLREELLDWLVNPNIALLMLVGGALLIYLEFNTPGTIVPGALGTLLVLLAVFGLDLLPIRYTAVLLLVAALGLLVLEAKVGGHGVLAFAGIVCLAFGMLTLVAAPVPELGVSPWIALAVSAAFGLITVFLLRLAVRARRMKSRLGVDAMVGSTAHGHGAAGAGGACAGGRRDLAGRGQRAGSHRGRAAGGGTPGISAARGAGGPAHWRSRTGKVNRAVRAGWSTIRAERGKQNGSQLRFWLSSPSSCSMC